MPKDKTEYQKVVNRRFKEVLKSRFNNNLKEMERACKKIAGDDAPSYGALRKHNSGSVPGLDQAAIIALAANVSLEWLAGIEKPRANEGRRAEVNIDTDTSKPVALVESGQVPEGAFRCLGYAFGPPGGEQLIVDFLIVTSDSRANLPAWSPRKGVDTDD